MLLWKLRPKKPQRVKIEFEEETVAVGERRNESKIYSTVTT